MFTDLLTRLRLYGFFYFLVFMSMCYPFMFFFFFFNDTATTEIYTLSLHDALPIFDDTSGTFSLPADNYSLRPEVGPDRKSTRLNSSHSQISYAVFCLKKKKKTKHNNTNETTPLYTYTTHIRHATTTDYTIHTSVRV